MDIHYDLINSDEISVTRFIPPWKADLTGLSVHARTLLRAFDQASYNAITFLTRIHGGASQNPVSLRVFSTLKSELNDANFYSW